MEEIIKKQYEQLKSHYECVQHIHSGSEHWFKVQYIDLPDWSPNRIPVVFSITITYPDTKPYGFYIPKGLNCNGHPPMIHSSANLPQFGGDWDFLSHTPDGDWSEFVSTGFNLLNWVTSFKNFIIPNK